ncbi:MAG: hypothetical protein SNJ33_04495 [Rikenellaceae bacterium]
MGKNFKSPKHKQLSIINKAIEQQKNKSVQDLSGNDYFVISFLHFDKMQSDSFESWENNSMLSKCLDVLANYSCDKLTSQIGGDKFTKYNSFPPNSAFQHPSHVPEDAEWARIHINGVHIVAGHIVKNVFYVVFLDSKHQFWKMKK